MMVVMEASIASTEDIHEIHFGVCVASCGSCCLLFVFAAVAVAIAFTNFGCQGSFYAQIHLNIFLIFLAPLKGGKLGFTGGLFGGFGNVLSLFLRLQYGVVDGDSIEKVFRVTVVELSFQASHGIAVEFRLTRSNEVFFYLQYEFVALVIHGFNLFARVPHGEALAFAPWLGFSFGARHLAVIELDALFQGTAAAGGGRGSHSSSSFVLED